METDTYAGICQAGDAINGNRTDQNLEEVENLGGADPFISPILNKLLKATLLGLIEPNEVMAKGTPELVIEKCWKAIDILSSGGGFFLESGCALPASTSTHKHLCYD